jgi:predicted dehydrogenase
MIEMMAVARSQDRLLAVGHMWRYHPEVISFRDSIRAGELGKVIRTHGYGVHAHWGPSGWFIDKSLAGGGALIDMGIHAIDTARFLLDDPQPVRVQARLGFGKYGDYEVDDDGIITVDWDNGVCSVIESGWWQPKLRGLEAETEVMGTTGYRKIWPNMPPVPKGYNHCETEMYARQLQDVVACISSGATPACSAEVGFTALDIVEKAYKAAAA